MEEQIVKNQDLLTEKIIGCCFKVHNKLGPGFMEKIYHNALKLAFEKNSLRYQTEKSFDVCYSDQKVGNFRADLLIENKVIVELKSVEGNISPIFEHQLLSYLKASGKHIGLLVNFGNKSCQIKRIVY